MSNDVLNEQIQNSVAAIWLYLHGGVTSNIGFDLGIVWI